MTTPETDLEDEEQTPETDTAEIKRIPPTGPKVSRFG